MFYVKEFDIIFFIFNNIKNKKNKYIYIIKDNNYIYIKKILKFLVFFYKNYFNVIKLYKINEKNKYIKLKKIRKKKFKILLLNNIKKINSSVYKIITVILNNNLENIIIFTNKIEKKKMNYYFIYSFFEIKFFKKKIKYNNIYLNINSIKKLNQLYFYAIDSPMNLIILFFYNKNYKTFLLEIIYLISHIYKYCDNLKFLIIYILKNIIYITLKQSYNKDYYIDLKVLNYIYIINNIVEKFNKLNSHYIYCFFYSLIKKIIII